MTTNSPDESLPKRTNVTPAEQPDDLVKVIEESELPAEKKAELVRVVLHYGRYHEGPLPPAEEFSRYNEIVPGAGDRILGMAEKEQQMRANAQEKILSNERTKISGAILLGILLIVVATLALFEGNTPVAISFGLVGALTSAFRRILDFLIQKKRLVRSNPWKKPARPVASLLV